MLSKQAVSAFVGRKLDDYTWVHDLSARDLDNAISELTPKPHFHTLQYRHQLELFLIGMYVPQFLIFADMGLGKSSAVLNMLKQHRRAGTVTNVLVLVPNVVNIQSWVDEGKRHAPDVPIVPMFGSSKDRIALLEKAANGEASGLFVLNYQGMVAMAWDLVDPPENASRRKKKKKIQVPNVGVFGLLRKVFDGVVYDESQALRSIHSLTYKTARQLGKHCRIRYAMTGTPMGRDPHHLWPQFHAIDDGETFGTTLGVFRAAYFDQKSGRFSMYEYKIKPGAMEDIHRATKNRSLRYVSSDCVDLPEQTHTTVQVNLPAGTTAYHDRLLDDMKRAKGNYRLVESVFIRMRQIAAGFLTLKGDDSEKVQVTFPDQPKIDALMGIIDGMPPGAKLVVFHEFIRSGQLICDALTEAKIKHVALWGGTKDKPGTIAKFQRNKTCRVLVANSKSGGTGLNLQVANYAVYYEQPVDPIVFAQTLKRVHRVGQTNRVFYYYLIMRNTVDVKIQHYLHHGQNAMRAVVDGEDPV